LLNKVDARYRSSDGEWVGITGRVRTVDYNTKLVQPADLPNSIFSFTDPKWKGKVAGHQQMVISSLRHSLQVSQGEKAKQWLEGIKNNPQVYPKNTAIVEALSW